MNSSSPRLPTYGACEFSLFISYAHSDNEKNNNWVTALKDAIWSRLSQGSQRDIAKKAIHFSEENGPAVGHLASQLEDRVAKSFAMLLVIGDEYARSGWCEKELESFCRRFGPDATRSRLLIAVMSKPALDSVSKGQQWQKLIAPDQLWVPMFQAMDPDSPLDAKIDSTFFEGAFYNKVKKLVEPLNKQIKDDEEAAQLPSTARDGGVDQNSSPWSAPSSRKMQICIGPHTAGLAEKATVLKAALSSLDADISALDSTLLLEYDPDDGSPIRNALKDADVLVMPISYERPLRPEIAGGHTTIVSREWAALRKTRSIVWYCPDDVQVPVERLASPAHLQIFKNLAPVCASEQAVANVLFTGGARNAIKVYIEDHDAAQDEVYKLSKLLVDAWKKLPGNAAERPMLTCPLLKFSDLELLPKNVGGFVLLLPHGVKPNTSLRSQTDLLSRNFPKEGIYPGCVALFFKTPGKSASGQGWPLLEFIETDDSSPLVLDTGSQNRVAGFLQNVLMQYQDAPTTN